MNKGGQKSLILCGFKASGKTSVGKLIANLLEWPFFDTDDLLTNIHHQFYQEKMTCRDISVQYGQSYFREIESLAIRRFLTEKQQQAAHNEPPCIIATGGSSVLNPTNVEMLRQLGTIIYLKSSLFTLKERLLQTPLPSFLDNPDETFDQSLARVFREREPIYRSVADHIVDAEDKTLEDLAHLIVQELTLIPVSVL